MGLAWPKLFVNNSEKNDQNDYFFELFEQVLESTKLCPDQKSTVARHYFDNIRQSLLRARYWFFIHYLENFITVAAAIVTPPLVIINISNCSHQLLYSVFSLSIAASITRFLNFIFKPEQSAIYYTELKTLLIAEGWSFIRLDSNYKMFDDYDSCVLKFIYRTDLINNTVGHDVSLFHYINLMDADMNSKIFFTLGQVTKDECPEHKLTENHEEVLEQALDGEEDSYFDVLV